MSTIPHRPGNPFGVLTAYKIVPPDTLFTITQVFDSQGNVTEVHLDRDCTLLVDFREEATTLRTWTVTACELAVVDDACPACIDRYQDVLAGLVPPVRFTEADDVIVERSWALFETIGKPDVEAASANMALFAAARSLREATVTRDLGRDIVATCHDRVARVQGSVDWVRYLLRTWTHDWLNNRATGDWAAALAAHGHRDPFADGAEGRLREAALNGADEDVLSAMDELRGRTAWVVAQDDELDRDLAIAGAADRDHPLLLRVPVAALFGARPGALSRARIAHPDGNVPAAVVAAAYAVWETRRDTDLPELVDAMRVAGAGN